MYGSRFFEDLEKSFSTKSQNLGGEMVDDIEAKVRNFLADDKATADNATKDSQKATTDAVDYLITKRSHLQALQENIRGLNDQGHAADSMLKRLVSQVTRTALRRSNTFAFRFSKTKPPRTLQKVLTPPLPSAHVRVRDRLY